MASRPHHFSPATPAASTRGLPRTIAVPGRDLPSRRSAFWIPRAALAVSSISFAAVVLLLIGTPHLAFSQSDQTWINGNSNWDLAALSWDGGVVWTNDNNAIFSGVADTITLGAALSVNNITFNSNGFVIQDALGGSLSLASPSTITVTNSADAATINAEIIDGSLTKAGSGMLVLGGDNSFDGNVLVNSGVLRITHDNALGSTLGSTTVANLARLELSGGITVAGETITINGSGGNFFGALQSVSGANVWAGNVLLGANNTRIGAVNAGSTLTISGVIDDAANTFTLAIRNSDAGGETILSGVNTYKGSTDVIVGILKLDGGNNRLPTGTTLQIGNASNVSTATFDLNGFNQQVAGLASLGTTMSRTVTNSSATASTLTVNTTGTLTYAGFVTGNLSLVKTGSGTTTLSGANTYTGTTTVSGGVLQVAHNEALGSTSGMTIVQNSDSARVVLANGVTVSGETIQISGNGDNNGALQSAAGATATWDGDIILSGSSRIGGGTGGTLIVNGVISGAGGLLFSRGNDATTILNAVNTYTGDTQMFANGGTRATLRIGVDHAISPLSQLSTINANATRPMDLDLNGHVLTLRALDTSARHENGANIFILNNGLSPSVFTISGASGSTNFTGILADGTGGLSLVKDGASTQVLAAASTYTGSTTVRAGVLQIGGPVSTFGANGALASTQFHLLGGTLALDNLGATNNNADRLPDGSTLSFQGGNLLYKGSDQAATNSSETAGTLDFHRNVSSVTIRFGSTNVAGLTAGLLARSAGEGLGFINGLNLGMDGSSTASVARLFVTTAPPLIGTTDATSSGINASVQNTKIVPFLLGSATANSGGLGTEASTPNTFLTYHAGSGLRPLNPVDEFSSSVTSGDNVRITANTPVSSSTNINSLIIDGSDVNLTINSGQTLSVDSGAILFSSGNAPRINGPGTLHFGSQEGLITINSTGNTFITSPISGTAGVTYHGTGTLVLGSQQNTYSGDTVLRIASVIPQSSSQGPAGAPTSGPFGTGRLILDGSAIRATTGTAITIGNETIIRADTTIPGAGVDSKNLLFTGPVTLEGGDRTIIHNSPANTIFSGVIGDGGQDLGLTIAGTGSGSVILSGANTYTGATTVNGATLLVNGSTAAASTVTVTAGTLGGGGTISGDTTIRSGATLTAGSAGTAGSLTFGGDLTLESGSTWLVDFVAGISDFTDVSSGLLTLAANLSVIDDASWTPNQSYQIASYASLSGTFFGLSEGSPVGNFYIHYGSGTDDFITLQAIPEPEAFLPALLILGLGLLLRRHRRLLSQAKLN